MLVLFGSDAHLSPSIYAAKTIYLYYKMHHVKYISNGTFVHCNIQYNLQCLHLHTVMSQRSSCSAVQYIYLNFAPNLIKWVFKTKLHWEKKRHLLTSIRLKLKLKSKNPNIMHSRRHSKCNLVVSVCSNVVQIKLKNIAL